MKDLVEPLVVAVLAGIVIVSVASCADPMSNPSSIEVVDHSIPAVSQPTQQPFQEKQPCG